MSESTKRIRRHISLFSSDKESSARHTKIISRIGMHKMEREISMLSFNWGLGYE